MCPILRRLRAHRFLAGIYVGRCSDVSVPSVLRPPRSKMRLLTALAVPTLALALLLPHAMFVDADSEHEHEHEHEHNVLAEWNELVTDAIKDAGIESPIVSLRPDPSR